MDLAKCKERAKELMVRAPWMRQQFLSSLLKDAVEEEREEDVKRIQEQIRNEQCRRQWRGIKQTMNGGGLNSVTHCQVAREDGTLENCDTKEEVEEAISNTLSERFSLANSAPICRGPLFELLGFNADTETAETILDGTFVPPEGTDGPTCIILEEISRIWHKMEGKEVDMAQDGGK